MPRGGKGVKNSEINKIIIIDHNGERVLVKTAQCAAKRKHLWQYENGTKNDEQLELDIKEITRFRVRLNQIKKRGHKQSNTDTKIDETTWQIDLRVPQRKRGHQRKQPSTFATASTSSLTELEQNTNSEMTNTNSEQIVESSMETTYEHPKVLNGKIAIIQSCSMHKKFQFSCVDCVAA